MNENKVMTAKQLIRKIQKYVDEYGDLPLSTWDGFITNVRIEASNDGCILEEGEIADEFSLEIITEHY